MIRIYWAFFRRWLHLIGRSSARKVTHSINTSKGKEYVYIGCRCGRTFYCNLKWPTSKYEQLTIEE